MSWTSSRPSAVDGATVSAPDGSLIQLRLADSWRRRALGLLGSPRLVEGEGLLLTPCGSVHTSFMRYAIDVAYLDAAGVVVRVAPQVRPWRFTFGGKRARMTLELAAGEADRLGLAPGQRFEFHEVPR
jgi:uncharacterized membrane protein (UPF0127 family)